MNLLPPTAIALLLCAGGASAVAGEEVRYGQLAPILGARCVVCHSGPAAPLGLRLDSLQGLLAGSKNGPVVKEGAPGDSELIRRIKGVSQPRMPMTGPPFLSAEEINLFERWVASGRSPGASPATSAQPPAPILPEAGGAVTYAHVAPIFAARCAKCHTDGGLMGPPPEGLRLTSYAATLATSDRARVVPGNPGASELVRRIRGQARPRMPFDGPPYLNDDEIRLIAAWVEQGARDAAGNPAPSAVGARVRLHGTLSARWRLDDLPLAVTGSTRLKKKPGPGDYVQVRGHVAGDGSVLAERIRRR